METGHCDGPRMRSRSFPAPRVGGVGIKGLVQHPAPGGQPTPGTVPKLPNLLGGVGFKMKSRMDTTNEAGLADGATGPRQVQLGQDKGTRVGKVSTYKCLELKERFQVLQGSQPGGEVSSRRRRRRSLARSPFGVDDVLICSVCSLFPPSGGSLCRCGGSGWRSAT